MNSFPSSSEVEIQEPWRGFGKAWRFLRCSGMGASNVTSVHPAVHKTSSAKAGNRIREGVMDGRNRGVVVREGKVSLVVPTWCEFVRGRMEQAGLVFGMSSKGTSLNFPQSSAEEQWKVSTWCVHVLGYCVHEFDDDLRRDGPVVACARDLQPPQKEVGPWQGAMPAVGRPTLRRGQKQTHAVDSPGIGSGSGINRCRI